MGVPWRLKPLPATVAATPLKGCQRRAEYPDCPCECADVHGPKTVYMTDYTVLIFAPRTFTRRRPGKVWVALRFVWILRLRWNDSFRDSGWGGEELRLARGD